MDTSEQGRRGQLMRRLQAVNERIETAMGRAGRAGRPTLIVVTKNHPGSDIELLAACGVRDIGENRHQEACAKYDAIHPHAGHLRWHFLGQLQRIKVRKVCRYTRTIHSVDRMDLVNALGSISAEEDVAPVRCFIQVNLEQGSAVPAGRAKQAPPRGGAPPAMVMTLADAIVAAPALKLMGLMTVAPLGWEPERAFAAIAALSARLRAVYPTAGAISAGMSADFELAIEHGATHLRVGSDVLGSRTPMR